MKKIIAITSLVLAARLFPISTFAFADTETNQASSAITQAQDSNTVQAVILAVPTYEKNWPQQPEEYMKQVNEAAHVLGDAKNDPNAKKALLSLFDNMMQKRCPTNQEQAASWIDLKNKCVLYYFNFDEIQNDKSRLVKVAEFIGEIRSMMIPDFRKTAYLNPPYALDASPQQIQEAVDENKRNTAAIIFQNTLSGANSTLTFIFLHDTLRFLSSNPTNAGFIREIIASAHLTAKEQSQLQ